MPLIISLVNAYPSAALIYCFILNSCAIVSIMGATYAVIPAYESDLFGSKYLASNHGRMLLASTGAGKYK
jgi:hypothetical protein